MLMDILIVLAVALEAYLLGSIDTGILVSRLVYHDDVRKHGSGAAGMTNMLRTFGKRAAAMVHLPVRGAVQPVPGGLPGGHPGRGGPPETHLLWL